MIALLWEKDQFSNLGRLCRWFHFSIPFFFLNAEKHRASGIRAKRRPGKDPRAIDGCLPSVDVEVK
jgi:hypothetical protein